MNDADAIALWNQLCKMDGFKLFCMGRNLPTFLEYHGVLAEPDLAKFEGNSWYPEVVAFLREFADAIERERIYTTG
jgi:hypothetical protein